MDIRKKISEYQNKKDELDTEKSILVEKIEMLLSDAFGRKMYVSDTDFDVLYLNDEDDDDTMLGVRFSNFTLYSVRSSDKEFEQRVEEFFQGYEIQRLTDENEKLYERIGELEKENISLKESLKSTSGTRWNY